MKKEIINPTSIGGVYSTTAAHGIKVGNFLFTTGQVGNPPGVDPRTPEGRRRVGEMGTVEEQTVRIMENLKAILEAAGTSLDNVVKRTTYFTHPGDFDKVYKVMERYFKSPVASTGVVTGLIPTSARLEVEVIAVVPD